MRAAFLDHIVVMVRDLAASQAFYEAALAPFGARVVDYGEIGIGVGPEGSEDLGLREGEPRAPMHIAFAAADPATVDAFHAAAMKAGGTDNGAPGRRPQYHERYYAAFVLDPDGNNVEAVCHTGPTESEQAAAPPARQPRMGERAADRVAELLDSIDSQGFGAARLAGGLIATTPGSRIGYRTR